MLVSINEVANRLKISNRAVQIKCKKQGVLKIGNQYQLTEEIAQRWYESEGKIKRSEQEVSRVDSYAKRKKNDSFLYWFIIGLILVISIVVFIVFYFTFETQIKETKKELHQERTEHKTDVKELRKKIDSQKDIISKKEIEIQRLKNKDSLRLFKP